MIALGSGYMFSIARTLLKKHLMSYVDDWNSEATAKMDQARTEFADDTGAMITYITMKISRLSYYWK